MLLELLNQTVKAVEAAPKPTEAERKRKESAGLRAPNHYLAKARTVSPLGMKPVVSRRNAQQVEALRRRILDLVSASGDRGVTAKEVADATGLTYQAARSMIGRIMKVSPVLIVARKAEVGTDTNIVGVVRFYSSVL